jgi:phenylalanyl-tRNA synthetase beta chain
MFDLFILRYDLLCLEGIAQALRVFNEEQQTPTYTLASIPKDSMLKMHVKPQVCFLLFSFS